VRNEIPLHHASRHWTKADKKRELSGNDWMRWSLFLSFVFKLDVAFEPEYDRKNPPVRTTHVVARPSRCLMCGNIFIKSRNSRSAKGADGGNCSIVCGSRWRERQRSTTKAEIIAVSAQKPQMISVATVVIGALAELDDQSARHAVMAFVAAWLANEQRPQGKSNGAAEIDEAEMRQ